MEGTEELRDFTTDEYFKLSSKSTAKGEFSKATSAQLVDKIDPKEFNSVTTVGVAWVNTDAIEGQVHVPHKITETGVAYAVPHKSIYHGKEDTIAEDYSNQYNIYSVIEESGQFDTLKSVVYHPAREEVEGKKDSFAPSRKTKTRLLLAIAILVVTVASLGGTLTYLGMRPYFQGSTDDRKEKLITTPPTEEIPQCQNNLHDNTFYIVDIQFEVVHQSSSKQKLTWGDYRDYCDSKNMTMINRGDATRLYEEDPDAFTSSLEIWKIISGGNISPVKSRQGFKYWLSERDAENPKYTLGKCWRVHYYNNQGSRVRFSPRSCGLPNSDINGICRAKCKIS